jgi:hypothetical protein
MTGKTRPWSTKGPKSAIGIPITERDQYFHCVDQGAAMGRKPKTTGPRARDPGAFKSVLVRMNIEGWRALKVLAVEKEATLNAMAVEAFNDLLKKHGKRQSVENPLLD